jgi:hypothetical protein
MGSPQCAAWAQQMRENGERAPLAVDGTTPETLGKRVRYFPTAWPPAVSANTGE